MKKFDKALFLKNITYLIKTKKIKIGKIEKESGVSVGYFSRLKREKKLRPGIGLIVNLANHLNVSIDSLLFTDMAKPKESDQYINNFLEKVIQKTKENKIQWEQNPNNTIFTAKLTKDLILYIEPKENNESIYINIKNIKTEMLCNTNHTYIKDTILKLIQSIKKQNQGVKLPAEIITVLNDYMKT